MSPANRAWPGMFQAAEPGQDPVEPAGQPPVALPNSLTRLAQITCLVTLGRQPFRRLLVPRHLGQLPDPLTVEVAKNNFQAEEASPRILAPDSRATGGISRRGGVCLLLADAEHRGLLVFAHAEEGPAANLPDGSAEPEVGGLLDLRQRHGPRADVVGTGHLRSLLMRCHGSHCPSGIS